MASKENLHKNRKSIGKMILIFISIITTLIIFSFILVIMSSEKVGDWYYKQNVLDKSVIWYEMSYDIYHDFGSLEKLCISTKITDDFERQTKYLPLLLKRGEDKLSENEYNDFLSHYIISLYNIGQKEEYKIEYRKNLHKLINKIQSVMPLESIIFDSSAKEDDYNWAIDVCNELLIGTENKLLKSVIYLQLSDLYSRLGDEVKAEEMVVLSEETKQ